jgi:curved DNA-binding protein CbpA
MAGQLKTHPLTELIREISAAELSGALRLTRERAKAAVYFNAGEIIYAVSNLRPLRLAESARRWKVLSEEQLSGLRDKASDFELGAALVESGALTRETLDALLERQVSELLLHTLLWTDGDWDFDPRVRITPDVVLSIKTKKLLTESARRLPAEFVAGRFKDKDEKLFPEMGVPDDINLLPNEAFVLTRVDMPLSVNELLAVGGLPEAETLQIVYTLSLGGFLRRDGWPQAFSAEALARARSVKVAPQASQAERPAAEPKREAVARPPAPAETQLDEQGEINALFAKVHMNADHYQLLGVRRSATASEIKRAYYALAKRFHPDRFRRDSDEAELTRIQSAFAQIAQAYDTLKDQSTRAGYDSKLLKQESAARVTRAPEPRPAEAVTVKSAPKESGAGAGGNSPPASPAGRTAPSAHQAEEKFQEGLAALQRGNSAAAIASLGEAARLAPTESRYRAHYGQALASEARMRHSAEAEMKAAISLDANNAAYRVMLAELYVSIGLLKRAQGELKRALETDPRNAAARRLLDKMNR